MNAATLRLTGVVSELPAPPNPLHRELRELIAENDRLLERNAKLKRERDAALDRVAELLADRRRPAMTATAPEPTQPGLEIGRLKLNPAIRMLSLDQRETLLSGRMVEMLTYLMARPDCVVQTMTLARALHYRDEDSVRSVMYRLRARLAEIGALDYLRTYGRSRAGGGYWMAIPGGPS